MKLKPIKIKRKKSKLPSDNLYIALIGHINAEVVSDSHYINRGEIYNYYTAVQKEDVYDDVFNDNKYNFRDENDQLTILSMYKYPSSDYYIDINRLTSLVAMYNKSLENTSEKKADNRYYVRTRTYRHKKNV